MNDANKDFNTEFTQGYHLKVDVTLNYGHLITL